MPLPARDLRDLVTRVPIHVAPHFGDTPLGMASGFLYRTSRGTCFVTNWHVVAGRRPDTLELLDKRTAAMPDRLRLALPWFSSTDAQMLITWRWDWLPLYHDEARQRPRWFVHPVHKHMVDVVALPVVLAEDTALVAANDKRLDLDDLRLTPSLDVYIVGFPRGMFGGANFPIWKRGSIASEPDIDIDGKPMFYVDAATREGMSGAPVFAQDVGLWGPRGAGTDLTKYSLGKGRAFAGVYSGRIGAEDEFKAQLGFVWRAAALEELADAQIGGDSPFEMSAARPTASSA